MTDRAVTKQLIGVEDLLLGTGAVDQARASGTVSVRRIDANQLPYENTESLRTKLAKKVEVLENVTEMQALPTNTAAEQYVFLLGYSIAGDGGGGLFWLDITDITSAQDLSAIFNPDVLANGRWKRVDLAKQITSDYGDSDGAIALRSPGKHIFATNFTANRVASLPSVNLYKGYTVKVIRLDTAAYTLDIGGIITLPSGGKKWVELTYNGANWLQTGYGDIL